MLSIIDKLMHTSILHINTRDILIQETDEYSYSMPQDLNSLSSSWCVQKFLFPETIKSYMMPTINDLWRSGS